MARSIHNLWLVGILASIGQASASLAQTTYYVNGSCGSDSWSGTSEVCASPDGPKRTIQAGINAAASGDIVVVADGTYTGAGNKDLNVDGVAMTVRSAGGSAKCIIDCEADGRGFEFRNGEGRDTVIEGFTITNGLTSANGGAIYFNESSPTIRDCVFVHNKSGYRGGAISCDHLSSPLFTNCLISGNSAEYRGGGINCDHESSPIFVNSVIAGNSVDYRGGGLHSDHNSTPTLINCVITGNFAERWGSGILADHASQFTIINCTITENLGDGKGIFIENRSVLSISNSIIWNNASAQFGGHAILGAVVSYSVVQGGWAGLGNIETDPFFIDPAIGDYRIERGSPCIDAASNGFIPSTITTDFAGNPRFVEDHMRPNTGVPGNGHAEIADIGAFEFQAEACYMDCDQSTGAGVLDMLDFLCFQSAFMVGDTYACNCDVSTGSGVCDIFDFLCFQNAFVGGCP